MKLLKLMTCAAMMAAMLTSTASAQLVNPGFEDAPFVGAEEAGFGTGWTALFNAGQQFRIQGQPPLGPAGAHGGDVALKVFGDTGLYQDFAASEGQLWDGAAWVINDSLDAMAGSQVAAVNIDWLDGGGTVLSSISNGTFNLVDGDAGTQDVWVEKTISGAAPAGTATARFILITGAFAAGGGPGGGAPRYDDASFGLRAVPEPGSLAVLGLGALGLISRRRRS